MRFLRAYQYWVLMDLFGNPPFITEATQIGGANPSQIRRDSLYGYVVKELTEIETKLPEPRTAEYGRADRAAAWALLARVYLNSGVYKGGTADYANAVKYAKKVIDVTGYQLMGDYRQLMLADNNSGNNEFIFTINYDGQKTQGYGGTTFLTHASIGGSMSAVNFGMNGGWYGLRTTKAFVQKFPDNSGFSDERAQFYQSGQSLDIADITSFTNGFAITKYRNVTKTGAPGSNDNFADIDIPLFRLPEMFLIYAEATKLGGASSGGDIQLATGYINKLRERAFNSNSSNITSGDITVDFILDERARELYWEGHRRTDLVRHNRFTTADYLWPWKGGVPSGTSVSGDRNLYPIPSSDINANLNLVQNQGY